MQLWEVFRHCAGIFSSAMQYLRPTCPALARCHPSLQKKHLSYVNSFTPATAAPMSNSDAQLYYSRAVLQHPDITGRNSCGVLGHALLLLLGRNLHNTLLVPEPTWHRYIDVPSVSRLEKSPGWLLYACCAGTLSVLFSLRQSGSTKACLLRAQYLEVLDFGHTGRLPP
jgi:hypothetical protein